MEQYGKLIPPKNMEIKMKKLFKSIIVFQLTLLASGAFATDIFRCKSESQGIFFQAEGSYISDIINRTVSNNVIWNITLEGGFVKKYVPQSILKHNVVFSRNGISLESTQTEAYWEGEIYPEKESSRDPKFYTFKVPYNAEDSPDFGGYYTIKLAKRTYDSDGHMVGKLKTSADSEEIDLACVRSDNGIY